MSHSPFPRSESNAKMPRSPLIASLIIAISFSTLVAEARADGPSFQPDVTFQGSSLAGWHVIGDAVWDAHDGEISGTAKEESGGWLVLDRSYQDVGFYTSFQCTGDCKTGVLFRAEKTADGMKGVFVSLAKDDIASYAVWIDAQGREIKRERLSPAGGAVRIAPPPSPGEPRRGSEAVRGGARSDDRRVTLPLMPPDTTMREGDWNDIEILLDANIVRAFLNDGPEIAAGVVEDNAGGFGPLALYVGRAGEVRFRNAAYKDLARRTRSVEEVSSRFRMQRLSDFYYAWGAAAADFNQDGVLDIVAGPHVYFGPDYTVRREIYLAQTSNPSDTMTNHCWMQFASDFTGDGWPDVINPSFWGPAGVWLYVNPKGEARRWDKYLVVPSYNSEIGVLRDVDGDGRPELVYMAQDHVRYARPDPASPTGPWIVRTVSDAGYATSHGIGVGDINGDGRMDIVNPFGWWEQPTSPTTDGFWAYHPAALARYGRNRMGGSVMAVYDVNGDDRNDVVTALNAHGWGLAWYENTIGTDGKISFVQHMIMDDFSTKNAGGVTFSQLHGTTAADVDGDGILDFIVGKRYWSHNDDYYDPDPYGDAVLYWYRTVRNPSAPGGAEFVPELIHNRSGAGSDVLAVDLNGDGRMDITTATKYGTFIFWGQGVGAAR